MSYTLKKSNDTFEMILVTDDHIAINDKKILALVDTLLQWGPMGDIKDLTLTRIGGDPNEYDYNVENKSGNHIVTTLVFQDQADTNPMITIVVQPAWLLSILGFGGSPRQQLFEIRAGCGIISFDAIYT